MDKKDSEKIRKIIEDIRKGKEIEDITSEFFPNLIQDLSKDEHVEVKIDALRQDQEAEYKKIDELRNPDTIAFIRRCDTEDQAEEIIRFQLKRCQITEEQANRYLEQLKTLGLRSFGSRKEQGYYEKKFPRE